VDRRNVRDRARLCSLDLGTVGLHGQSDLEQSRNYGDRVSLGRRHHRRRNRHERHRRSNSEQHDTFGSVHADQRAYGIVGIEREYERAWQRIDCVWRRLDERLWRDQQSWCNQQPWRNCWIRFDRFVRDRNLG
jgi:hypothetical protein